MTDSTLLGRDPLTGAAIDPRARPLISSVASDAPPSAVSWGAILAGAAGAAALSLILLILGTGLGLSSISPFSGQGASATTFGASGIAWLTFTQLAAAGLGGYLAGRLRTRWHGTHQDEVYFRDTAHGFLAWAIATLAMASLLTSTIGSIVGAGANAAGSVAGGAGRAAIAAAGPAIVSADRTGGHDADNGYFVDSLFRPGANPSTSSASAPAAATGGTTATASDGPAASAASTAEAARIFASALESGNLPAADVQYLAQVVSQRTGLAPDEAQKRVTDAFAAMKAKTDQVQAQARVAAEKARKAAAYTALWLFVALLLGAFVASLTATFGGRQRDLV